MKNRKYEYPWQSMLIINFLGFIGGAILFFTKIFEIRNLNDFINYFVNNALIFLFSLFFIFICIYVWMSFIKNVFIKPKKDVLYLLEIEDDLAKFINRKGKIYYYENKNFSINEFYDVLKTQDIVKNVLGKSLNKFKLIKERRSYWLNYYSPFGNFENMLILPILYLFLIIGIFSIIYLSLFQKIYDIFFVIVPLFLVVYDLMYKIKLKRSGSDEIDNFKKFNIFIFFRKILIVTCSLIIFIFVLALFINLSDITSKIILLPFLLCAISITGQTISNVFNNTKWFGFFKKMYLSFFLLYWFGILLFGVILAIKQKKYQLVLFTIQFWVVGIFLLIKNIFNNRK